MSNQRQHLIKRQSNSHGWKSKKTHTCKSLHEEKNQDYILPPRPGKVEQQQLPEPKMKE
jgi:hypothetical protein